MEQKYKVNIQNVFNYNKLINRAQQIHKKAEVKFIDLKKGFYEIQKDPTRALYKLAHHDTSHSSELNKLKYNMKTLEDQHSRLKFMISEIETVLKRYN